MPVFVFIAADLIAMIVMVFGLYFPRHRRRDMIAPFLAINVGVLGVTYAMATTDLSLGFGLGIFAVLSIIRLRSAEMDHAEIAYYFTAIALGLLGGFPSISVAVSFTLMVVLLAVLAAGDHPGLFRRSRQHVLVLDRAVAHEDAARDLAQAVLGAPVKRITIRKVDFVTDTTVCDVRYDAVESDPNAQSPGEAIPANGGRGSVAGLAGAGFAAQADAAQADAAYPIPAHAAEVSR
ncbi:DUF4956 domain-containing protein [Demequina sp. TTPB684]|uniref:DUF4956 domain-containing protein n=1 Tax=unclassified Demequina TaxID=2620311 RepID=UPI001CF1B738|nr:MULTISPECIES: DUF4956 domain-containing protein [unclassified Demequina]MCB2411937.1 DUF4956 domain-containing protein [Demequina sp. TTPB684]UPU88060.1 DUF4956 domain-containing protein [Demequina sp. TMPB413]